jgi:hypothetical protein
MIMKRMKNAFIVLAFIALALGGCGSAYDYYSTSSRLDRVVVRSSYWPDADTAIVAFAEAESLSAFNFRGYEASSKKIKKLPAEDSTVQIMSMTAKIEQSKEPMSIRLALQYKSTKDQYDWYAHEVGEPLFVDIYGCSDFNCKNVSKIVVHSADYSYSRLVKKGEFEISKSSGSFWAKEDGYDCDVTKEYLFHVKIDMDDFRIDMDVQKGKETCLERDAICYGFCG